MHFGFLASSAFLVAMFTGTVTGSDETSKVINIGTDVATLLVFHPDSLAGHSDDPIGWYSFPFATVKDLEQGKLIGFFTGSDGGYRLRMTTTELTNAEKKFVRCSVDFRLQVDHGWVALDNSDGLPGEEQQHDLKNSPDLQFHLPNGKYRVTVFGIDWHKAPEGVDSQGRSNDKSLPSYVIRFRRVDNFSNIDVPACLPDLRDEEPSYHSAETPSVDAAVAPLVLEANATYPLILTDSSLKLPTGLLSVSLSEKEAEQFDLNLNNQPNVKAESEIHDETPETWLLRSNARRARFRKMLDRKFVVANRTVEGDVAAVCKISSMGKGADNETSIGLSVLGFVRLTTVSEDKMGTLCEVSILDWSPADDEKLHQQLQETFVQFAHAKPIKAADFYSGSVRQQTTISSTARSVLDHFEVSAERFREYVGAGQSELARMMIADMRDSMKE